MIKIYDEPAKIIHNPDQPYITDQLYRFLSTGGSGSDKTTTFLNLIKHQRLWKKNFILKRSILIIVSITYQ